jgi:hypothetical protein
MQVAKRSVAALLTRVGLRLSNFIFTRFWRLTCLLRSAIRNLYNIQHRERLEERRARQVQHTFPRPLYFEMVAEERGSSSRIAIIGSGWAIVKGKGNQGCLPYV